MNQEQPSFGPALAIVIIIAVVGIGGILFYRNMVKDIVDQSGRTQVQVPAVVNKPQPIKDAGSDIRDGLSKDIDTPSIESDLETTPEVDVDLSFLDELDAELLDYEELDVLNLDL